MAHIMAVCQVRTFTTLVENGQSVVAVTSVIIALALNTVILAQVLSTPPSTPPPVILTEKKFQHHSGQLCRLNICIYIG